MDINISQDKLKQTIGHSGQKSIESRQLASRLRQLLPDQLKRVQNRYRQGNTAARAHRLALLDEEYISAIEELVEFSHNARDARVRYDTHMMLLDARRTLRRFNAQ